MNRCIDHDIPVTEIKLKMPLNALQSINQSKEILDLKDKTEIETKRNLQQLLHCHQLKILIINITEDLMNGYIQTHCDRSRHVYYSLQAFTAFRNWF